MGTERVKTLRGLKPTSVTFLLRSIREILSEMPLTKKMTTKSLEPPLCLVLPRLNLFVHNNRNRRQGNQFCKPHLLAVELGPWAVGSERVEH